MPRRKPIVIKTYRSDREYQKDANKMLRKGYEIQETDQTERAGLFRWLLVGPLALAWKKHRITVTYRLKDS